MRRPLAKPAPRGLAAPGLFGHECVDFQGSMTLLPAPPTHVIFDLDGTLLDTEPLYTEAAQAVVGPFGGRYDWSLKRKNMGRSAEGGAALVIAALGLPLTVEQYLGARDRLLRELFLTARPMPGAPELVARLHLRGVGLAIGTSSFRHECDLKLSVQPFLSPVNVVVCRDDPGVEQGKPAPDIFLRCAAELGAEPARCLVLEDTPAGVQAARAAGMACIALVDPNMRGEDFEGALAQIDSLEELTLARLGL